MMNYIPAFLLWIWPNVSLETIQVNRQFSIDHLFTQCTQIMNDWCIQSNCNIVLMTGRQHWVDHISLISQTHFKVEMMVRSILESALWLQGVSEKHLKMLLDMIKDKDNLLAILEH